MKVSVILPVYNAKADELRISIDSILNQTFQDFEFIIINDGSTNDSDSIIRSYSDKRIRYVQNEKNLKIIRTLNKGLEISQGKYIARIDSDDYSDPSRLEKQYNYLEEHPSIGLVTTLVKKIPGDKINSVPETPKDLKLFTRYCGNCIVHSSVMLRKSVLVDNNLKYDINCMHAEDVKLWSDMSRYCDLGMIPEVLTVYRMSEDGISASNKAHQAKMVTVITLDNIIKDFARDKNYMYSILVKYIKGVTVSDEEFYNMNRLLIEVTNYLQERINPPFKYRVKNFILSVLVYFVREQH